MYNVCNPSDILESSLSMHDKYRYAKIRKSYTELLEKYDKLLKNLNYRDFELKRDLEMAKSIDKETTIVLARALNLYESMTCILNTWKILFKHKNKYLILNCDNRNNE